MQRLIDREKRLETIVQNSVTRLCFLKGIQTIFFKKVALISVDFYFLKNVTGYVKRQCLHFWATFVKNWAT